MKISNYKTGKVGWVIDYNESKIETKIAARIGGNISGNRETIERLFNHFASLRESANLKNRFIHLKLSLSPLDKSVTSRIFRQLSIKVLKGLGLDNNPFTIYRHYDTDHPHLHIVICRITFDGLLIRDSFDGLKLKKIERELEEEFGLTPSFKRILTPNGIRLPQKWEQERIEKTGIKSVRNYIQCGVIESLNGRPNLTVFVKRLERRGIMIWHREIERSEKKYHGLSYSFDPTLTKIQFNDKSTNAMVAGIGGASLDTLSNGQPDNINHPFFGNVIGRLITNLRGIPEFCLQLSKPDDQPKPYSFRAANLGPFFQYPSIVNQLSSLDEDTFDKITLRVKRKPKPMDYLRRPLTFLEGAVSKLIFAAEIKSELRVTEALSDGLILQDVETLDRSCNLEEIEFIHKVLKANSILQDASANKSVSHVELYTKLVLRYITTTSQQPDIPTIKAIRLIAEQNWDELKQSLTSIIEKNDRKEAPDPSIMYLGVPSSMAFTMMDFQHWYQSSDISLIEDVNSKKLQRTSSDTANLLKASINFDNHRVDEIMAHGMPDFSVLSNEDIEEVSDSILKNKFDNDLLEQRVDDKACRQKTISDDDQVIKKGKLASSSERLNSQGRGLTT